MLLYTAVLTVTIYCLTASLQGVKLMGRLPLRQVWLLCFAATGTVLHGYLLYRWIDTHQGQNLDVTNIASLVTWLTALLCVVSSSFKPLANLTIFILPVAALSIVLVLLFPGRHILQTQHHIPELIHILLSVTAFSILAIAALQAVLLAVQDYQLHNRKPGPVIRRLPPLQTMETLLFQMIRIGLVFLTLSLASGGYYIHTLQHAQISHKILLALVAWLVFAWLLWGRHRLGWRGRTAVRWTLAGFVLLGVSYFGTRLVL